MPLNPQPNKKSGRSSRPVPSFVKASAHMSDCGVRSAGVKRCPACAAACWDSHRHCPACGADVSAGARVRAGGSLHRDHARRQVPPDRAHRRGRDGAGLSRRAPALDAQVAVKLLNPDVAGDAQTLRALPDRSARRVTPASPEHHPGARLRPVGHRASCSWSWSCCAGATWPRSSPTSRRCHRRALVDLLGQALSRARRGARRRRRASRLQAGEHLRRDAAHRQRARQGARLRHRQAARRGRRQPDLARRRLRHARLHEPRADPRRGARRALRRLRRRRRALRGDDRHAPLRQRRAAHRRADGAPQSARRSRRRSDGPI